jgi:hypothetical protein
MRFVDSALEAAVTRDSGSELPPDGTVHALASNVIFNISLLPTVFCPPLQIQTLNYLKRLHESSEVIGQLLQMEEVY